MNPTQANNDEKKFPPTRYINVGRRNTTMAQAYDARAEISKDMEWDVYISIDEVTHILSEERARLEEICGVAEALRTAQRAYMNDRGVMDEMVMCKL